MTGFEAFTLYQALKLHFTTDSYDFFKYGGKTRFKMENFENRNDKYHFLKLSRKYPKREILIDFLVANLKDGGKSWIGELIAKESEDKFLEYQRVIQSLSYIFESDCRILFDGIQNPNDILKTQGEYPLLLEKVMRKDVHLETLCILNILLNFLPMWRKRIDDDIKYPDIDRKIIKYSPFIPRDDEKFKKLLKKVI